MMMTSCKKNAGTTGADRGTVVGVFRTQVDAERAIRDLKDTGIDENRMGVAMMDRAAAGGLMGALVGMGIPEEDARYFEQRFQAGGVLVTVDAGSRGPEAREILRASGADLDDSAYAGPERRFSAR
jgi:hypothetical protein